MRTYRFEIEPVAKPRMTSSDKWKKRTATDRYWLYKDHLRLRANMLGIETLPTVINAIDFYLTMPKSWSKKKRKAMNGKLHTQKPDLDNLLKGIQDALCKEDSHIAQINRLSKTWAETGQIEIEF